MGLILILAIFCCISIVYASTTIYMSCGDVQGIPYDIPGVVRFFVNIIKLAFPIILILMGSIDFAKAVVGDDKELSRATKKFTSRCFGGVWVFFIVFVVQLLLKMVGANSDGMM